MRRFRWPVVWLILAGAIAAAAAWYDQWRRWTAAHTGSINAPGTPPEYNFFSGFGSIILPPVLNGVAVGAVFWWHHQCGVHRCYWYARRVTAAGERACFLHHPDKRRTVQDVHDAHHRAIRLRA